jgi:hypothetical protein
MKHALPFLFSAFLAGCGDNLTHPPDRPPYESDAGTLGCVPNLDGKIEAAELKAALNVPVNYLVSPQGVTRKVDLVGQVDGSGHRVWDFSQDFADDAKITISATALSDKWYQASFPNGQWVAPIDAGGLDEGVYSADDQAIYLHGLASKAENPAEGKTLVVYDQPVAVYRLPLKEGASWVGVGKVENAMIRGLPYAGTDTYEIADDATGEMDLHDYIFTQVHRIRTKVTLAPAAGATQVTRQASFVFECFGEVVRATSQAGEANDDFDTAAELRRLGQ